MLWANERLVQIANLNQKSPESPPQILVLILALFAAIVLCNTNSTFMISTAWRKHSMQHLMSALNIFCINCCAKQVSSCTVNELSTGKEWSFRKQWKIEDYEPEIFGFNNTKCKGKFWMEETPKHIMNLVPFSISACPAVKNCPVGLHYNKVDMHNWWRLVYPVFCKKNSHLSCDRWIRMTLVWVLFWCFRREETISSPDGRTTEREEIRIHFNRHVKVVQVGEILFIWKVFDTA